MSSFPSESYPPKPFHTPDQASTSRILPSNLESSQQVSRDLVKEILAGMPDFIVSLKSLSIDELRHKQEQLQALAQALKNPSYEFTCTLVNLVNLNKINNSLWSLSDFNLIKLPLTWRVETRLRSLNQQILKNTDFNRYLQDYHTYRHALPAIIKAEHERVNLPKTYALMITDMAGSTELVLARTMRECIDQFNSMNGAVPITHDEEFRLLKFNTRHLLYGLMNLLLGQLQKTQKNIWMMRRGDGATFHVNTYGQPIIPERKGNECQKLMFAQLVYQGLLDWLGFTFRVKVATGEEIQDVYASLRSKNRGLPDVVYTGPGLEKLNSELKKGVGTIHFTDYLNVVTEVERIKESLEHSRVRLVLRCLENKTNSCVFQAPPGKRFVALTLAKKKLKTKHLEYQKEQNITFEDPFVAALKVFSELNKANASDKEINSPNPDNIYSEDIFKKYSPLLPENLQIGPGQLNPEQLVLNNENNGEEDCVSMILSLSIRELNKILTSLSTINGLLVSALPTRYITVFQWGNLLDVEPGGGSRDISLPLEFSKMYVTVYLGKEAERFLHSKGLDWNNLNAVQENQLIRYLNQQLYHSGSSVLPQLFDRLEKCKKISWPANAIGIKYHHYNRELISHYVDYALSRYNEFQHMKQQLEAEQLPVKSLLYNTRSSLQTIGTTMDAHFQNVFSLVQGIRTFIRFEAKHISEKMSAMSKMGTVRELIQSFDDIWLLENTLIKPERDIHRIMILLKFPIPYQSDSLKRMCELWGGRENALRILQNCLKFQANIITLNDGSQRSRAQDMSMRISDIRHFMKQLVIIDELGQYCSNGASRYQPDLQSTLDFLKRD